MMHCILFLLSGLNCQGTALLFWIQRSQGCSRCAQMTPFMSTAVQLFHRDRLPHTKATLPLRFMSKQLYPRTTSKSLPFNSTFIIGEITVRKLYQVTWRTQPCWAFSSGTSQKGHLICSSRRSRCSRRARSCSISFLYAQRFWGRGGGSSWNQMLG